MIRMECRIGWQSVRLAYSLDEQFLTVISIPQPSFETARMDLRLWVESVAPVTDMLIRLLSLPYIYMHVRISRIFDAMRQMPVSIPREPRTEIALRSPNAGRDAQ